MGVYLSTPNTELEAEDGHSSKLVFGAASMQGWRVGQEDAHIAIVDYDTDTSLFGVFDGHGGQEVAKYCAQHLPDFIKSLNSYQNNKLNECLEEAFLKFDQTLTQQEVINELKLLSGNQDLENDNESDDDINEAILLREEADIPIADLMARYNKLSSEVPEPECSSSSGSKSRLALPSHMRNEMKNNDKSKPVSPYLRAKRNASNESNRGIDETADQCTSSSASSGSGTSSTSDASNWKADKEEVSNSEPNSTSQPDSTIEETITKSDEISESKVSNISNGELLSTNDNTDCLPTSSITDGLTNEDNQNNSENNCKINSESNSEVNEAICDTSAEQSSTELPYRGKGKHKKIISSKTADPTSTTDVSEETPKPIYRYFLEDFDESDDSEDNSEDEFEANDDSSDEEQDDEEDEEVSDEEEEEDVDEEGPPPGAACYERPGFDSGCTAVVALLKGNELFVANAGDSRCVVSRDGKAVEMSVDHKPEDDIERNRVERAGGKVTPDGRVNGGLNLSRAIGDHAYKRNKKVSDRQQMITALPDIKTLTLEPSKDRFLVIACDGIWNSMTSQQVIDFVAKRIESTDKLSTICDEIFKTCLAPNTHGDGTGCDNMTCVIIKFIDTTPKRKLDDENDNEVVNQSESDANSVPTEEPKLKKIKTNDSNDCETEDKGVNENEGSV